MRRVTSSWFVTDETEETDLRPPNWGAATAAPTRHRASTAWGRFLGVWSKNVSSSRSHLGGCHCLCLLCRSDLVAARGCIYSNQRARFPAGNPRKASALLRTLYLLPALYHFCQPTPVQAHSHILGRGLTSMSQRLYNLKCMLVGPSRQHCRLNICSYFG